MEDFVRGVPGTLDAPRRGTASICRAASVSGCSRTSVSLNRPILLLDEPTSNVDPESEAVIFSALRAHSAPGGRALAITHRVSLFDRADVVYRLQEGRIISQPAAALRLVGRQGSHGA